MYNKAKGGGGGGSAGEEMKSIKITDKVIFKKRNDIHS